MCVMPDSTAPAREGKEFGRQRSRGSGGNGTVCACTIDLRQSMCRSNRSEHIEPDLSALRHFGAPVFFCKWNSIGAHPKRVVRIATSTVTRKAALHPTGTLRLRWNVIRWAGSQNVAATELDGGCMDQFQ